MEDDLRVGPHYAPPTEPTSSEQSSRVISELGFGVRSWEFGTFVLYLLNLSGEHADENAETDAG